MKIGLGKVLGTGTFAAEKGGVGPLDFLALRGRESCPLKADRIQAGELIDLMDDAVGWNVPGHYGIPLNYGTVSDASDLVDAGTSSKEGLVPQSDMAGDHGIVGENIIISDYDVMREMGDGH